MNFLLTVCAGFLTYYHQVQHCGAFEFDLDAFMKNFERSQSELQWIRDQSRKVDDKGNSVVDSKESNFDDDDESSVDLWYNKYRKSECSMNHANQDSKILNGYCGVNDDDNDEHSNRYDGLVETNSLEHLAAPADYKIESQDTKREKSELSDSNLREDKFDNLQEEGDHDHFNLDSDSKLSLDDKLNIEEYNEQMIPNPNFYKINNELSLKNEQINKDHDTFRNDLGFSSHLSKYPSGAGDIYHQLENENQNNFQRQTIQRKRNARNYDKNDMYSPKRYINQLPYDNLNDQEDTSKNDLSHEADYKLSKNEQDRGNKPENGQYFQSAQELPNEQEFQDAQEIQNDQLPQNDFINKFHKEPKNRPHNPYESQNPVQNKFQNQHVGGTDFLSNHFQDTNRFSNKFIDPSKFNSMKTGSKSNVSPKKQSLKSGSKQYMKKHDKSAQLTDEINLKISNRMMSKGLGPSLPSESMKNYQSQYRHPMNIDVENQHWKDTGNDLSNDLTDYVGMQRHLLQFDYDESLNDYALHENIHTPNEKGLLKIGLVKTFNNEKQSNDGEIPKRSAANSSEKLKLNNNGKQLQLPEKANEKHFNSNNITQSSKENQKLLSLEKCVTNCEKSYNEGNDSGRKSPDNSTIEKQDDHKIEPKSESNNTLNGHINSLKLQLELNISNETLNEASSKVKNNKSTDDHAKIVKRSATYEKQLGIQETKIQEISKNSSIVDLVSGKLPNQLIQAVFQLVKENSHLNKLIGSKLDMKSVDNLDENSINLFQSKQKTERMVKKLMSSITGLIEEQITHQTCILLPPDLQSFYDKVIYVRSINARVNNMRKQNKSNTKSNKDATKRVVRSTVPESDLHQKYKTVGTLLKQFGHLKLRDQVKIFDIKQYLQNHLQLLDDLKTLNSEFVRRSRSVENKNRGNDIREKKFLEMEKGARHISREYANLLKTTKLIKTTSLTDMDRIDVISSYK